MTSFRGRPLEAHERDLCERYHWLARARASRFHRLYGLRGGMEPADLTQMACLGLALAAKGFRADGGAAFTTYARVVIDRELARLARARAYAGQPATVSLHESVSGEEDGQTWEEIIPDPQAADPCEEACRSARDDCVGAALAHLDERHRRVLEDYHVKQLTLKDVAAREGVSPQRIHQVLQTAGRHLRAQLEGLQYVLPA